VFDRSNEREHAAFARPVSRFARHDTLADGFELHPLEACQQMLPNLNRQSMAFIGHTLHCELALLNQHAEAQCDEQKTGDADGDQEEEALSPGNMQASE